MICVFTALDFPVIRKGQFTSFLNNNSLIIFFILPNNNNNNNNNQKLTTGSLLESTKYQIIG
jgi:hypothetical protein